MCSKILKKWKPLGAMASFFNRPVEARAHGHVLTAKAQSLENQGFKSNSALSWSNEKLAKKSSNPIFSLFSTFFLFSAKKTSILQRKKNGKNVGQNKLLVCAKIFDWRKKIAKNIFFLFVSIPDFEGNESN